jgi:gluconokinase
MNSIVVMGVAGCGKSSLAQAIAAAEGLLLIEGDDHHSAQNKQRMSQGVALTDADREGWLAALGELLRQRPQGVLLTCSALKRAYREQLRVASPGLRFVFLDIERDVALARVAARAGSHFFCSSLVDSQFATLETPSGEAGVLQVDATLPISRLQQQVHQWLAAQTSP